MTPRRSSSLFDDRRPLRERVREAFGPAGPIARATPGFRPRDGQAAFADAVAEALEADSTVVAEAGTGTGKTFAYLVPALLSGAVVVISTAGKPLQDQLFKKDIPALSRALGIHPSAALLKGRANYVCLHHLKRLAEDGWLPEKDSFEKLRRIQAFAAVSPTGDKAELSSVPEDDALWPYVTSTRENCLGPERCPHYAECFVKRAREAAAAAQIVVVNHHLYLSSMAVKKAASGAIDGLLPKAALTVFDEAHQLPGIASDFFGTFFTTFQLLDVEAAARELGMSRVRDGADWAALSAALQKTAYDLRLAVRDAGLVEGDRKSIDAMEGFSRLAGPLVDVEKAFGALLAAMKANAGRDAELDTLRDYAEEVFAGVRDWRRAAEDAGERAVSAVKEEASASEKSEGDAPAKPVVRWISVSANGVRFTETPLSFAEDFRAMRGDAGGAYLFTSATLSSAGDFTHFLEEVGLSGEAVRAETWPSPFNYWEQGCFYLPKLPAPANNSAEHAQRMVEAAWPLVNAAGGKTFFLCTSLSAVASAAEALRAKLEANGGLYPLFVQGEKPKAVLIDEFRRRGNAVLVGSMSFWEGVDVRGDALSLVVIDKIPFAPPDDPVDAARCRAIRERGGNPFAEYVLPEAVIALKQGAGRLIRSETDRGVFMLCDVRAVERGYGRVILSSLPDFFRTRRMEKVIEFFSDPERFREGLYR